MRAIRELCCQEAWEGRLSLVGLCNFPNYELEVCGVFSPSHSAGGKVGTERTPNVSTPWCAVTLTIKEL